MPSRTIVDLSHPLDPRVPMFPGLPAPGIEEFLSREASRSHYAGGTTFLIQRYHLIGNSGTYLDSPFHRHADGPDLATLPLERLADLPGIVLDVSASCVAARCAVDAGDFAGLALAGASLLVRTGWDARWPGPGYLAPNPYLTEDAAALLVERGAALVGIDTWNIDDTGDGRRPVHTALLAAGIPIVENLCHLDRLPGRGFRFHAAPLPIAGGSASPVRAYAVVG